MAIIILGLIMLAIGFGIKKLWGWLVNPLTEITTPFDQYNEPEVFEPMPETETVNEDGVEPLQIEIKKGVLDLSHIAQYTPDDNTARAFTPHTWDEYIGQTSAKKIIQSFIKGTKRLNATFPHVIIDGNAGFGKSTLIRLLQQYLHAELIEHIATELSNFDQLKNILHKINSSREHVILFIDEVHGLPSNMVEVFYPILQEGCINGHHIKPFTFACATTEKGKMIKQWKPFISRMDLAITLQDYSLNQMVAIIKQHHAKVFPDIKVSESDYLTLAKNSRLTPREANHLLRSYVYIGDMDETLKVFGIVDRERGLTKLDFKVLNYLNRNDKVGLQGLCSYLDTSSENFLYQVEPYLIKLELILRTASGRTISEKGRQLLTK